MKIMDLFRKKREMATAPKKSARFSDFFLHASEADKKRIFTKAAYKANEEQRDLFIKTQLKAKNCN